MYDSCPHCRMNLSVVELNLNECANCGQSIDCDPSSFGLEYPSEFRWDPDEEYEDQFGARNSDGPIDADFDVSPFGDDDDDLKASNFFLKGINTYQLPTNTKHIEAGPAEE